MKSLFVILCIVVMVIVVPGTVAVASMESPAWLWQTYDSFPGPGLNMAKWMVGEQTNVTYAVGGGLSISSTSTETPWFELEATPALPLNSAAPFAVKIPFHVTTVSGQLAIIGVTVGPPVEEQGGNQIFIGWTKGQGYGLSGQTFASGLVGDSGPVEGQFQTAPTSATQGRLGLTYDGTTFSCYYDDGSAWQLLYSYAPGWTGAFLLDIDVQVIDQGSLALAISDVQFASLASTPLLTLTKSGAGSGTVTSSLPGINCGSTCSASYASSTVVTLTATADAGSYFAGWSPPCVGNDTCTVTVTGSTRITAAFYPLSYLDTVQKLYIGYYQRPADPGGLVFWVNGLSTIDANHDGNFIGEDVTRVLEQFAYSAEAQALYGGDITGSNIATVVDSIYEGLFGRSPEDEGKAFWINSFNTGASTPATILWELMKGAQGTDAQTVQNRLVGATRYTHVVDPNLDGEPPFDRRYAGYDDCAAARVWLSGVTWNPATIPTEGEIRALLPMP
jgi:hypothetical protein